jgi:hypothetical protein
MGGSGKVPQTCASDYGGPGDPTSGVKGYKGDYLPGKMAFAELNMGTALGNLPYRTQLKISYGGRSVVAEKLDIGAGGAGCGGHPRSIDLWYQTAQALGFSGLGVVNYERVGGITHSAGSPSFLETINPLNAGTIGKNAEEIGKKAAGVGGFLTNISPFEKAAKEAKEALGWAGELGKLLEFLTSSSGWVRIAKVTGGAVLLLIAINQLSKIGPGPEVPGPKAIAKVVK